MLGATQEAWLDDQFAATDARWNVVAQQTVMTATPLAVGGTTLYNFDQWDGYVAARDRLLRGLVDHQVRNPMVLSGDIHLAGAAALRVGDYEAPGNPDVAYEIVTTSISSGFGDDLLPIFEAAVPKISWVSYANARKRGYAVITVTPDSFTTDFRVVATALEPTSTVSTDHTDVVQAREPVTLPTEPPETTTTTTPGDGTTPTAPGAVPVGGNATYTG
jgi:alkaline phosphatase D